MKKVLALALTAAMALSMVACGGSEPAAPAEPEAATYKVGMGIVVSETPADATADKDGSAQINTTVALVTFDAEDKIVSASIDVAQQTTKWDATGTVTGEPDLRTKLEKGPDYGMKAEWGSQIGEWFEQIAAFETWMVGKTFDEVVNMEFTTNAHDYADTPADEDLKAGCTISMTAFLDAIKEAHENAVEVTGVAKVGLGSDVTATVASATADKEGSAQINSTWAGLALDEAGNIVHAVIDTAQQTTKFGVDGVVTANADLRTKYEKGPDYGMKAEWGSQIGEWFEQIDALTAWMTGKTVDAVVNMEFTTNAHDYADTPADEDLKAGCTISMTSFLAAIQQAADSAK
ncbi:MAG: hypothetical protein IJN69_04185 [Oscillospiraceae bacterium]|nr:hypothetical protein [Oscillospiraceae bacterium]